MKFIQSSSNKEYKFIKSLMMKKGRSESGYFVAEGIKSVSEALNSEAEIGIVAVSENALQKCGDILDLAKKRQAEIINVSERLFSSMSDTQNPEGVLCTVKMFSEEMQKRKAGLYIYCDRVCDPGNAGTLIRCADAVGAEGIIFSRGSVDIYNPKTVRAAMGSIFHVKVYVGADISLLKQMKESGYVLYAGALDERAELYDEIKYPNKTAIVIGNEANGVSEQALTLADKLIIIPIYGRAESINASVAGAVLMYEWRRNNKNEAK